VARERTDLGAGGGGGGGFSFGSGRWAGGGGGDRHRVAGGARHRNDPSSSSSSAAASSSSSAAAAAEEEEEEEETAAATARSDGARAEKDDVGIYDRDRDRGDEIVDLMRDVIAAEFEDGGGGGTDDATSTAIACTAAAVAVLSSMVALGQAGWGGEDDDGGDDDDGMRSERGGTNGSSVDREIATGGDFRSRLRMPLSDLLEEYGDRDADWMKTNHGRQQQQLQRASEDDLRDPKGGDEDDLTSDDDFRSRLRMPLSKLLADYGERDDGRTKEGAKRDGGSAAGEQRGGDAAPTTNDGRRHGMLAHYGKASVHLELASFGYKYGAPPHRSRDGFTYTRPLPPLDVRDLDRAPGHVSKFNGLSYLVRRSLLNPSGGGGANDDHRRDDDDDDDDCDDDIYDDDDGGGGTTTTKMTTTTTTKMKKDIKQRSPMRRRVDDIADEIIKVLVESIDEGGHGPVSPLTMTVSVGSEYGRHRSVVLVEHLAVVLRARLRRNDGSRFNDGAGTNGIVRQPVSVGTRHRDMDARHQDEEAFGEDLRREFRKAEKARTRQMRSAGWDDDGW
jgi:hypothetical protein